MAEYKVKFEVFEGPLDLLLYLVKKDEVDIYQVSLTKLATEFIEYVELMRELDLDLAGEFLVMAATLLHLKSRELLPVDQQAPGDTEDEEEDPRWELIRRLVEYKKFKDAALRLQTLEQRQEDIFPRQAPKLHFERPAPRVESSVFDLVGAVNAVLKRFQERVGPRHVFDDQWTVTEKIEAIRQTLQQVAMIKFTDLFGKATSRSEIVATFLALLELIRLGQVRVTQAQPFGEIEIHAVSARPASSAPAAGQSAAAQGALS